MRSAMHWLPVAAAAVLLVAVVPTRCNDCTINLVESIPENLTYPDGAPKHMATTEAWHWLLNNTKVELNMASLYWTMLPYDIVPSPSADQGFEIFKKLLNIGYTMNYTIRIVNNGKRDLNKDLSLLGASPGVHIQWLDVTRYEGRGILHTKLWLSDSLNAYVGSANMDWRSLTQVKELGVLLRNCPIIVQDMEKIFAVYWYLSQPNATIPKPWPKQLSTVYNNTHPLEMDINGVKSKIYISSSPPNFCPTGRTQDLNAILDTISKAKKFVYISVMDYIPAAISYNKSAFNDSYWPVIDDALRSASYDRRVEIRLLISCWRHSNRSMFDLLRSIEAVNGANHAIIKVKIFKVPAYTEDQKKIPFSRVNHNKYMVTDNIAYIGTSNWSGDYFLYTGGLAFVVQEDPACVDATTNSLRNQTEAIFLRDWNSKYAHNITEENLKMCMDK